jgi:alpha-galactosidase
MMETILNGNKPSFSFIYGNEDFTALAGHWQRSVSTSDDQRSGSITYTDPKTGLKVTQHYKLLPDYEAIDWVLMLENTGVTDTPLIEQLLPMDLLLQSTPSRKLVLYHANGSLCQVDDFHPLSTELGITDRFQLSTETGRSSEYALPFMSLAGEGEGWNLAIGWSGSWKADFSRSEEGIRIQAGMIETRFKLHPGEKIRTPRLLISKWLGDNVTYGTNQLRRLLLEQYCPKVYGETVIPPFAHMTMSSFAQTNWTNEENELKAMERAHELGLEAFWVDACWFGTGGNFWEEVGNWQVREDYFPNGLGPIGDAAHAKGMKFILWFEPERVRPETQIARKHPEYLLKWEHNPEMFPSLLLDLGNPKARSYILEMISNRIEEGKVDIYRQDFNVDPLPYWKQNDEPDRVGMKEIRHIEGLYELWDELKRRFPHLVIDNCASGGRRIDLETTMRSFPLWRSDFSDVGSLTLGEGVLQIGDQSQTAGLSRWLPMHSASVWKFSPYAFRSAMSTGLCVYCSMLDADFPMEEARQAFAELKRIRPYLLGDFHELVPFPTDAQNWCSYQFHREDLNGGIAVFLRRNRSQYSEIQVALEQIDPECRYEYSVSATFEEGEKRRVTGKELVQLSMSIPEPSSSLLLTYNKI